MEREISGSEKRFVYIWANIAMFTELKVALINTEAVLSEIKQIYCSKVTTHFLKTTCLDVWMIVSCR
jgi:hypothetical protein